MIRRFGYSGNPSSWLEKLETIKTARNEYNQNMAIMTPYERQVIAGEINQYMQNFEPDIIRGALAEWDQSIVKLQAALGNVEKAKQNEARRWDAARLTAEMQMIDMLVNQTIAGKKGGSVNGADLPPQLQRIYDDAQRSGDTYKQRAAAEVFQAMVSKVGGPLEDGIIANRFATQARRDVEATRKTAELEEAHKLAAEAVDNLNQTQRMLSRTSEALGHEPFEIFKAVNRVRVNGDGGFDIRSQEDALK